MRALGVPVEVLAFVPAYAFGIDGLSGPIAPWSAVRGLFGHLLAHGDAVHLLTNMATLAVFGPGVERTLGGRRLVFLFVTAGVVGALVEGWASDNRLMPLVGASGGISGVMAARVALHPASRLTMPPIFGVVIGMPLMVVVGCDLIGNIAMAMLSVTDFAPLDIDRVAWGAHLAGFATGLGLCGLLRPAGTPWLRWNPATAPRQFVGTGFARGRGFVNIATAFIWIAVAVVVWRAQ